MITHNFPVFVNDALCAESDKPNMWFPDQVNNATNHYRIGDSITAREICSRCPARQECLEYALRYTSLYGIWAGLDPAERAKIQDAGKLPTIDIRETLPKMYEGFAGDSINKENDDWE